MGILNGNDTALEHIDKSKLAFLATLCEVEKGPSTNSMPPKDHFTLKFDRDTIKNLKGRVYENMKQYSYEQRGESVPVFLNNKEVEDSQGTLINPIKPTVPTIGHQYVACIYDDLKIVDCLVEIDWSEVDDLVKIANARRKSIV
ncbi:unnamed protein product [Rotaria magnacalcarata]|uniref:Uncharacterized protein n=1 Tax=Rotaria magnacalcarata TaxID=392030 RepID=A0A819B6A8_9BILA|nr:unnamed protein product [Rotaria magnacalcarata]CAF1216083.1 unnamed protein product [Rotaria magnacalcarata]CAF2042676.1 unnamed protein product [Rotaria magnacalcarata]CAF2106407.1 unnamed protein product [Rotaria magnacalcarata]CAF2158222.1 unnamed protein product [Rotaria magnacalcarata]